MLNNKFLKQTITIVLAAVMMLSVFSGCVNEAEAQDKGDDFIGHNAWGTIEEMENDCKAYAEGNLKAKYLYNPNLILTEDLLNWDCVTFSYRSNMATAWKNEVFEKMAYVQRIHKPKKGLKVFFLTNVNYVDKVDPALQELFATRFSHDDEVIAIICYDCAVEAPANTVKPNKENNKAPINKKPTVNKKPTANKPAPTKKPNAKPSKPDAVKPVSSKKLAHNAWGSYTEMEADCKDLIENELHREYLSIPKVTNKGGYSYGNKKTNHSLLAITSNGYKKLVFNSIRGVNNVQKPATGLKIFFLTKDNYKNLVIPELQKEFAKEFTKDDTIVSVVCYDVKSANIPDAKPEETTKPNVKPETTKPEPTTKPSKPETTKPETTKPETTKPETTKPETTKPPVNPNGHNAWGTPEEMESELRGYIEENLHKKYIAQSRIIKSSDALRWNKTTVLNSYNYRSPLAFMDAIGFEKTSKLNTLVKEKSNITALKVFFITKDNYETKVDPAVQSEFAGYFADGHEDAVIAVICWKF